MTQFSAIEDFGISPNLLQAKYTSKGGSERFSFPQDGWLRAIATGDTIDGYWLWVYNKIKQIELERGSVRT